MTTTAPVHGTAGAGRRGGAHRVGAAVAGPELTLWEPGHGFVDARLRDRLLVHRPGSRAYLSAGLPGAEWWVAGPAVNDAAGAGPGVEPDKVRDFLTSHGLRDLT